MEETPLHELGVMMEVIKAVEQCAEESGVSKIDTLVLQIGELSSVIPEYVEDIYSVVAEGTLLENTKLEIEILPGNALCKGCGKVFNVLENDGICPHCSGKDWELLSGKEFNIKEIVCCD
jgi:hydrogenase nickel incorporation protein HypA/HybF